MWSTNRGSKPWCLLLSYTSEMQKGGQHRVRTNWVAQCTIVRNPNVNIKEMEKHWVRLYFGISPLPSPRKAQRSLVTSKPLLYPKHLKCMSWMQRLGDIARVSWFPCLGTTSERPHAFRANQLKRRHPKVFGPKLVYLTYCTAHFCCKTVNPERIKMQFSIKECKVDKSAASKLVHTFVFKYNH